MCRCVSYRYLIFVWQKHPEACECADKTLFIPLKLILLEQDTPVSY